MLPCHLTDKANATEASLAENAIREDMHPADEFEAFLSLSKTGIANADIGAKFGVTETVVERRLKLARVAPAIIEAYRADDTDLESVMAFAVTDDQKAQLKVWKSLSSHERDNARSIRRALTETEIDATDRRVKVATLKAYLKAGGKTRQDLFVEGESGIFIIDTDILNGLVAKKLKKLEASLQAEGWAWTEIRESFDYSEQSKFKQLRQEDGQLSPELEAEATVLSDEEESLYDIDADELTAEQQERLETIRSRQQEIEDLREQVWPEGTFEVAGAIVTIDHNGKPDIRRGLVRPGDVKKLKPAKKAPVSRDDDDTAMPAGTALSGKLNEQLTRHRTAALGAELMDRPDIALASVVYTLAGSAFLDRVFGESCLEITAKTSLRARDVEGNANERIERHRVNWGETLPATADALWTWCLAQEQDTLLDLLAFCAALTLDAVATRGAGPKHGHQLAAALKLDMSKWFTPGAANFFGSIGKPQILEALQDVKGSLAPAWTKAKRSDLAAIAEREIAGTGWLPAVLRSPETSAQKADQAA